MPNRWPITSGNWNDPTIWNGGLGVPTSADDVFANSQSIFINTDITIRTLNNTATTGVTAGGSFFLNNGTTTTVSVSMNVPAFSSIPLIYVSQSNSASLSCPAIGGSIADIIVLQNSGNLNYTGSIIPGNVGTVIRHGSTGVLNLLGTVSANVNGSNGIVFSGGGTINVIGTVNAGNVTTAHGIAQTTTGGTITVTGTVNGGPGSNTAGINLATNGNTVRINGTVNGGSGFFGINSAGTSTIIVTGSVRTTSNAAAISNVSSNIIVSGSVIAGPSTVATSVISQTGAGNITVIGPLYTAPNAVAIAASAGNVFATGPFYNTNNRNAVFAQNLQLISGSTPTWQFDTETFGGTKILYTSGSVAGYPSISNVRNGVIYGDTNQFTGTVVIPAASNVIRGALVDNTTGSASFTTQNAWSAATGSLTVSGSIGARLRNTATVNTDAALITTKGKI